ncbi:hypothetical protein LLS1_27840 [Leifsonia sp. LS1]|uniref:hypothetical protein n=1 Tax=unclassified Leifsonia TaxID=2663824 RepID=UPI001CBC31AE|nr:MULTISPECIES: hypothetical protein [unclassified Leifsonia]UAJ80633.1 hypothetical protein IT072_06350 [Leifsonia sp. ZF2019]GIT81115.1 hypothetical protein LLS1_27840 [Leifsonia sp. LS1]
MPLLEDLTVYEDGDVYTVYDHSFLPEGEAGRGRALGRISRAADGTYEPSGVGAVFEYIAPATTLDEALEAFVGSA